ncbi:MAG: glycerophosphodiester phosphodiesterase [Bryobacteraceae bacterium]|nr:glycerophosphodiester phosphodiesterase [Bryobacteraceae bacterium]
MRTALAFALLASVMMGAPRIQVHGHRGARAVLPENTIPAFEHAIEVGADVLELDMAVTKDNVVVVSHDPELNPKICKGPAGLPKGIRQLTLEQLRQFDCGATANADYPKQRAVPGTRMPTLDEVLALARRGTFEFNIETKIFKDKPEYTPSPEEFTRLVVDLVRKHKLEKRVILQSFDFRTLEACKKIAPEIRLSALYAIGLKDFVGIAKDSGARIVSPHYMLVTKGRVEEAHKAGLQVVPWTANTVRDWDRLVEAGVDAIITDDPAALIEYLKGRALR